MCCLRAQQAAGPLKARACAEVDEFRFWGGWGLALARQALRQYSKSAFQGKLTLEMKQRGVGVRGGGGGEGGGAFFPPSPPSSFACLARPRVWHRSADLAAQTSGLLKQPGQVELSHTSRGLLNI